MINANELRLGNWVFNVGDFVKITSVDERGINREDDSTAFGQYRSYYCTLPGPIGIPLTPEILEKCGFVNKFDNYYDLTLPPEKNRFALFYHEKGCFYTSDALHRSHKMISSLHDLQNLYFALTGEELQIDLNAPTGQKILSACPPDDIPY